jgi:hypothetical protein
MQHAGLRLDPPPDFVIDQVMFSFKGKAPTTGDPRVLQKQTPIRPTLILHRRDVGEDAPLEVLAGEVTAELVTSVPGLSELASEQMRFADGAPGMIVSFSFALEEVGTARQFHALRKDGAVLTTLTLTVDKLALNDAAKERWLSVLASAVTHGDGGLQ